MPSTFKAIHRSTGSSAGTLELATRGAAGTGAITFAPGAGATGATLRLDTALPPTNTICGFAPGDAIDLRAVSYSAAAWSALRATPSPSPRRAAAPTAWPSPAWAPRAASRCPSPHGGTRLTITNAPVTLDTVQGESGRAAQFLGALASPATLDDGANGGPRLSALLRDAAGLLDPAASLTGGSTVVAAGVAAGVNGGNSPLPLLPDAATAAALSLAGGLYASAGGLSSPTTAMAGFASTSAGLA